VATDSYDEDERLFAERYNPVNFKFITSLTIFHAGAFMTLALGYDMGIENTLWNDIVAKVLLIGGAVFAVFYAIKRIVVACGRYADWYITENKMKAEITILILTVIATVICYFVLGAPALASGNPIAQALIYPCFVTIPFVIVFRIIAIIAMKKNS
jgi:hypothetical protein